MTTSTEHDIVFQYSEWLDQEGLVLGHEESGDDRSHDQLVTDFFGELAAE